MKSGASWYLLGSCIVPGQFLSQGICRKHVAIHSRTGDHTMIDEFGRNLGTAGKGVALVLDLLAAGILVLFGIFGNKSHSWLLLWDDSLRARRVLISPDARLVRGWFPCIHFVLPVSRFHGMPRIESGFALLSRSDAVGCGLPLTPALSLGEREHRRPIRIGGTVCVCDRKLGGGRSKSGVDASALPPHSIELN